MGFYLSGSVHFQRFERLLHIFTEIRVPHKTTTNRLGGLQSKAAVSSNCHWKEWPHNTEIYNRHDYHNGMIGYHWSKETDTHNLMQDWPVYFGATPLMQVPTGRRNEWWNEAFLNPIQCPDHCLCRRPGHCPVIKWKDMSSTVVHIKKKIISESTQTNLTCSVFNSGAIACVQVHYSCLVL